MTRHAGTHLSCHQAEPTTQRSVTLQLQAMAECDRPVGMGVLITVDTTVLVDMNAVASAIRNCHDCMINLR
jgi:hypothetical protein